MSSSEDFAAMWSSGQIYRVTASIDVAIVKKERERDFKLNEFDRFRCRTRYFIDSGVIGSREFVDPSASPNEIYKHHLRLWILKYILAGDLPSFLKK